MRDAEIEGATHDRPARLERGDASEVLPEPERDRGQREPAAAAAVVAHLVVAVAARQRMASAAPLPVVADVASNLTDPNRAASSAAAVGSVGWTSDSSAAAELRVTRIILGCGNFGGIGSSPAFFGQGTSKPDAFRLLDTAWDAGITTYDTADAYGGGRSETLHRRVARNEGLGRARPDRDRDEDLQPDGRGRTTTASAGHGSSARSTRACAGSASSAWRSTWRTTSTPTRRRRRRSRRSPSLIAAGKVGAVGASNFTGEQLAEALELARLEGLPRYEWVQNGFSLLDQGDRETVFPVCREHGLGYTPFSPLAGGWLTGKYRRGEAPPAGSRMTLRPEPYVGYASDRVFDALEALERCGRASAASRWPGSHSPGRSPSPS